MDRSRWDRSEIGTWKAGECSLGVSSGSLRSYGLLAWLRGNSSSCLSDRGEVETPG